MAGRRSRGTRRSKPGSPVCVARTARIRLPAQTLSRWPRSSAGNTAASSSPERRVSEAGPWMEIMASSPENSTISTYNLHLVRHPVAVEVFQHTRCEEFVHLPQKAAGGAQHPHVGQDLSLGLRRGACPTGIGHGPANRARLALAVIFTNRGDIESFAETRRRLQLDRSQAFVALTRRPPSRDSSLNHSPGHPTAQTRPPPPRRPSSLDILPAPTTARMAPCTFPPRPHPNTTPGMGKSRDGRLQLFPLSV